MSDYNTPFIPLVVSSITDLSPEFKMLTFAAGHGIDYRPGQYLTFVEKKGQVEIRRSYSILSIPVLNEPLSIGVKRIENGHFSRKLVDRIHIGDTLFCSGAGGFFQLPDDVNYYQYIVFFAAGSGITPIYSLLRSAIYQHEHLKVILYYSNHSPASTALYEQIKSLQQLFQNRLTVHFLFSNEKELKQARLTRDHLIDFISDHRENLDKTFFYTCGPETFMMKVMFVLVEFGVSKDQIRKEEFVNRRSIPLKILPPVHYSGKVKIHYHGILYNLNLKFPETILEAAKKLKLNLPYSCEMGKCGSCAATCIEGKVWLSNNEVLTDADLKKNIILTCVGHPLIDTEINIQ